MSMVRQILGIQTLRLHAATGVTRPRHTDAISAPKRTSREKTTVGSLPDMPVVLYRYRTALHTRI